MGVPGPKKISDASQRKKKMTGKSDGQALSGTPKGGGSLLGPRRKKIGVEAPKEGTKPKKGESLGGGMGGPSLFQGRLKGKTLGQPMPERTSTYLEKTKLSKRKEKKSRFLARAERQGGKSEQPLLCEGEKKRASTPGR